MNVPILNGKRPKQIENIATTRRLGQFTLNRAILHNSPLAAVRKVMSNFIVLEAKRVANDEGCLYLAYSNLFREIDADDQIPVYAIHISTGQNGAIFVRAQELSEGKSALEEMKDALTSTDDDESVSAEE
jgi:hypothetical protein